MFVLFEQESQEALYVLGLKMSLFKDFFCVFCLFSREMTQYRSSSSGLSMHEGG